MDIAIGSAGITVGNDVVAGATGLEQALGPPTRRERAERAVPGLEELGTPLDVAVWDDQGLMAGDRFVAIVTGDNNLNEPIWPGATFAGRVLVDGQPIDVTNLKMDPLHEDRFSLDFASSKVVVIADWKRAPVKVLSIT